MTSRTVIITGASRGIGAATARLAAQRGYAVCVNYLRRRDAAESVVNAITATGGRAVAVQGDVASDQDCRRLVETAVGQWGRLDVLVNNAAVTKTIPQDRFDLLDAEEFERTFAVNLIGNYQMCRAAAPHLKASGDAAIVNISSIGAFQGAGSSIAYAASKGALNTMTLSMARALAPQVRVTALCPGGPLGSWTRKIMTDAQYQARVREAETEFPLKRGVWAIDVARAALFLIEHATVMTGECLRMDAGKHLGEKLIRDRTP